MTTFGQLGSDPVYLLTKFQWMRQTSRHLDTFGRFPEDLAESLQT